MGKSVDSYLLGMELGAAQSFENMTVFGLLTSLNGGPEYVTLKEALETGVFTVTEVSEGGSVPELKVENRSDIAVLLLDGEELRGAKQNRVLNTTILVAPKSAMKVPVSCTEHGRWSYESRQFAESGNVMAASMRGVNLREVNRNLEVSKEFRSNQAMIWDNVAEMAWDMKVSSRTGAMRDVFEAKGADLDGYLKNFKAAEGLKGILVFIDGKPAGMDFVSRDKAFGALFPKLVKSYAMEAMLLRERRKAGRGKDGADKATVKPGADDAREFLKRAAACEEKKYESVGMGWSYRYSGAGIVGSALAVDEKVVHMAFFSVAEAEVSGNMAGTGMRRNFRIV
ncbi:MAG: hypothetical protein NT006_00545 [Candidatus Aminicenantes bacterium]|nr:hypothetical protein [Candidatus Aminicenantes bacterium]